MVKVDVSQSDDLERAIRKFNRKCNQAGIFKEIRRHAYYVKPAEKRKKERKQKEKILNRVRRKQRRRKSK